MAERLAGTGPGLSGYARANAKPAHAGRMMSAMRLTSLFVSAALLLGSAGHLMAETKDFLGRWNLQATDAQAPAVFWLELTEENGQVVGKFLNRGGSPVKLASVSITGDQLTFTTAGQGNNPGQTHKATLKGGKLTGEVTMRDRTITWVGVRPPKWAPANANAAHTFGKPVVLVDGTSLEGWKGQRPDQPLGWTVEDGAITNGEKANNLVSTQTFKDFKVQAEYKVAEKSNSGIYLRGRYELQVLDDFGKEPEEHQHMAIYAWTKPLVNVSKKPGEWQAMEATIVGNKVTVILNGTKVHDNATIQAITGGALDANEDQPGPIMLQGDHGKVWFRKLVVTPIVKPATE